VDDVMMMKRGRLALADLPLQHIGTCEPFHFFSFYEKFKFTPLYTALAALADSPFGLEPGHYNLFYVWYNY
jgi:hypothetical protein